MKIAPYVSLVVGVAIAITGGFADDTYASLIGMGMGLTIIVIAGMWIDLQGEK